MKKTKKVLFPNMFNQKLRYPTTLIDTKRLHGMVIGKFIGSNTQAKTYKLNKNIKIIPHDYFSLNNKNLDFMIQEAKIEWNSRIKSRQKKEKIEDSSKELMKFLAIES